MVGPSKMAVVRSIHTPCVATLAKSIPMLPTATI